MQQIINFIRRNKTFLLFLLLFSISILFTIQSHLYHKNKYANSTNAFVGGIYNLKYNINYHFKLKKESEILLEENNRLKSLLFNSKTDIDSSYIDTLNYKFTSAKVLKNSYALTKNYLTINKGKKDGIGQDFGVVTSKGIVGIVDYVSNNYAGVISILNTKSRINAQLKKTNHIGSLVWDTKSPEMVQLADVSKFAPIKIGDTIVTGGQSTIFPKGILIGKVNAFSLDKGGDTYTVEVKLFNDMTNVGHVHIIENLNAEEIKSLQNLSDE